MVWKNQVSQGLPTDLDVCDIDGDGRDEALLASADGTLYALDHTGQVRWKFHRQPPLLQVCAIAGENRRPTILTGGMEKRLYALTASGNVSNALDVEYPVRHIRSGNFLGDGREYAAVITAKNDRGRFFLQLYNAENLEPIWEEPLGLSTTNATEGTKYFVPWMAYRVAAASLLAWDINGDGRDEMLITDYFDKKGVTHAFDAEGKKVFSASPNRRIPNLPYRMNLLIPMDATDPDDRRILGLYGNQISSTERMATSNTLSMAPIRWPARSLMRSRTRCSSAAASRAATASMPCVWIDPTGNQLREPETGRPTGPGRKESGNAGRAGRTVHSPRLSAVPQTDDRHHRQVARGDFTRLS